jgi:hypothetical protein
MPTFLLRGVVCSASIPSADYALCCRLQAVLLPEPLSHPCPPRSTHISSNGFGNHMSVSLPPPRVHHQADTGISNVV